jgi:hypothetical protein
MPFKREPMASYLAKKISPNTSKSRASSLNCNGKLDFASSFTDSPTKGLRDVVVVFVDIKTINGKSIQGIAERGSDLPQDDHLGGRPKGPELLGRSRRAIPDQWMLIHTATRNPMKRSVVASAAASVAATAGPQRA